MSDLPLLNRALLPVTPASALPVVRILQIGDGNFLRAFVDWMVERTNTAGLWNARITLAAARGPGATAQLVAQEGLFTVVTRGLANGQTVNERLVVSCVDRVIDPSANWVGMLACALDPALRFVVSNTTEAGITDKAEDFVEGACPQSFPAKLAALLWARYQACLPGLIVLPCELLEANGSTLRQIVLAHAARWALPSAFSDWVRTQNQFLNTLVDRIVPGFPAAEEAALAHELGYRDPLLVAAEPFHFWAIEACDEASRAVAESFPLAQAGHNVIWTDDLAAYRTSKVRVLNGAHTASALAAFLAGIDTVKAMLDDDLFARYLQQLLAQEIVPFVPRPEAERQAYAATILERFANPTIAHALISIALNSVAKWQVRVLPSVKDYVAREGRVPMLGAFSLAALFAFYHGQPTSSGEWQGERPGVGGVYPIKDSAAVLASFAQAWQSADPLKQLLGDLSLWGEDLNRLPQMTETVQRLFAHIQAHGVRACLTACLN